MAKQSLYLGVSPHMGWVCATVIRISRANPLEAVYTTRLDTAAMNDALAIEPYHLAGGVGHSKTHIGNKKPLALIAEGRRRQEAMARRNLEMLQETLCDEGVFCGAGILASRGKLGADLQRVLASHAQIHIAEGLAVRESVARALISLGIKVRYFDKEFWSQDLLQSFGVASVDAMQRKIAALTPCRASPWRREEKLAACLAWAAASQ